MSTAASERAAYLARVERSARAALGLVEHYDGLDPKLFVTIVEAAGPLPAGCRKDDPAFSAEVMATVFNAAVASLLALHDEDSAAASEPNGHPS